VSREDCTGAGSHMYVTIPSFCVPSVPGTHGGQGPGLTLTEACRAGLNI